MGNCFFQKSASEASLIQEGNLDSGTLTSSTVAKIHKEEKDGPERQGVGCYRVEGFNIDMV